MGRVTAKYINGMNWWAKACIIAGFTLFLCIFMYKGWLKPLIIDSATNTYYFTLDSAAQNLGADGSTSTSIHGDHESDHHHYSDNTKISMTAGSYNTLQYIDARSNTNWQTMLSSYGPAYGGSQTLTAPTITIGTRDNNGTSNLIYWKADVYDYNPAGSAGNGVLLWSSTGTDESHSYMQAPLSLYFGNPAAKSIPVGHRLKVIISCRQTSTNSDAQLYWGSSTNYSFMSVTEAATAANSVTVTNLADYNSGGLKSVVEGEQNVAMIKFDLYANAASNWSGGKLDKIGSNSNLGDVVYSIFKDTNGNGRFDPGSDSLIGGPYFFSQGTGSGYTLATPQALTVIPQRYFITYSISGNAAPLTTVGARIADNTYFTVSSGTVTNVGSTSSSMPTINAGGTPAAKTYAADWDSGTALLRPESGGPTSTNSICVTSSVSESAGTSLVGLLNFPGHTCTSRATGTYHFSGGANVKFVSLYFNGPTGYPSEQAQVKGISFKFRARSDNSNGTFTLRLFYVKPDGTRVNSPVATTYTTHDAKTVTVSLAGQTFKNVPANSRLGIQIGVSKANCGVGLGGAIGSQLTVEETPLASTGVNIGDGVIVLGGNVQASDTENVVDSFTLSSSLGNQTVTSVTITGGPMTTSTNVKAVRLYADNGTVGVHDSADTLLGSGTFVGNSATVSGLSEAVSGTYNYYLVVYDITATPQTSAVLTGLVSNLGGGVTIDSNTDISSGTLTILPTTTITNGIAEPSNMVVASGGVATYLDAFGLKINGGGNDTINTVTVALMPAGISAKIAKIEIVDRNMGTVYGEITAPTGVDDWRLSTPGLVAKSATTECYVRITPKNNITSVLSVTGQIASITHSKGKNGVTYADSTSATITLDGQKPSDPVLTATSGSSSGQIQLSWTQAIDSSGLRATNAYTLVRGVTNAPAPVNCKSGVLVYQGNALSAIESGLSQGQNYGYRVCASDVVNNISEGAKASAVATIPTACSNAPTIIVNPVARFVKSGRSVQYTVSVTNNDTGACAPTAFTLALAGTENSTDFVTPSLLGTTTMSLGPNGGGAATPLTVTARPTPAPGAVDTIAVRVTATGHPVAQSAAVTTTVNDNASMMHTSLNLGTQKYGLWGADYTCTTCHSKEMNSNIKRVAPTIATPNGIRPVVFQSTSAPVTVTSGVFGNDMRPGTISTNICEVCHHKTRYHQYSAAKVGYRGHEYKDNKTSGDCMECHPHNVGFKAVKGTCSSCHGDPPDSLSRMAYPPTNALGPFAANAGAHAKHAGTIDEPKISCAACHSNANHAAASNPNGNNLIEIGFNINNSNFPGFVGSVTSGTVFSATDTLNNPYQWTTAPGTTLVKVPNFTTTCNVYCHGWPGSGGSNSIPSWIGYTQKSCGTCHYATGEISPTSGSHYKHSSTDIGCNGIACGVCHGTEAHYDTSIAHINGNVEWDMSAISASAAYKGSNKGSTGAHAPSSSYGTCTNLYCHSNVQSQNGTAPANRYVNATWGTTTHCGSCHDDMALSSSATGGHYQHAKDPQTQFECRICHGAGGDATPQNHANGRIDFTFSGLAANTVYSKGASKVPGSGGYGNCSVSDCHGRDTIAWGPASTLPLCDKCHGSATTAAFYDTRGPGSPTDKTEPYVGSHDLHIKAAPHRYANPMDCGECHINPGGPYSPGHIDTPLPAEVTFGPIASAGSFYGYTTAPSYSAANRQCSNFWCHGGGMASNTGSGNYAGCVEEGGTLGTPVVPKWNDVLLNGNPANDCTRCHAYPPCAPGPGYVHYGLTPSSCNGCHNNVTLDGTGFIDASLHVNGVVDGCFTCHGRPPVDLGSLNVPSLKALSPGNTGAHNAHTLNPSIDGFCSNCHNNYTKQMPSYNLQIGFNGYNGQVTSGTFYGYSSIVNNVFVSSSPGTVVRRTTDNALVNKCVNVYCHGGGTTTKPALTGGTNTQPDWELGYDEVACGTCHGVTADTYATTGSHGRHAGTGSGGLGLACERCHGLKENNYHVNGSVEWHLNSTDFRFGPSARYNSYSSGGTGRLAPSTSFAACSNLYCHSNVQGTGGFGNPSFYGTPQWGSTTPIGCGGCHKDMATDPAPTGSHLKHGKIGCKTCHNGAGSGTAKHADHTIDISFSGYAVGTVYTKGSHPAGSGTGYGTCNTSPCHGNSPAVWGALTAPSVTCLGCHAGGAGNRAEVTNMFYGNSHHIQGVTITAAHCYQCHWEANSDGTINSTYHQKTTGAPVDLVIYGAGVRPAAHNAGTFVTYTASGSRKQLVKINSHCLSCHNVQNAAVIPFADGKTPKQYAWDATTIAAKYGDTATIPWGKYNSTTYTNVTPKDKQTKAYSAHGNAGANQRGWNTAETWPNTSGGVNVLCFDCHNSHGSSVSGTTTSYTSATVNGGILKETTAGRGGYGMTYKPQAGGSAADHNPYNSGAALCFDCHLTTSAGTKPWGYQSTFGATQAVSGYMDTPYFGPGATGAQQRYYYKSLDTRAKAGHLMASAPLSTAVTGSIGGLCTPCHDPHGVSTTLGADKQYGVPLLKGTWMTSPYKEDYAPTEVNLERGGSNEGPRAFTNGSNPGYYIDQNTFENGTVSWPFNSTKKVTQTVSQFGGLCLKCHAQASIAPGAGISTPVAPWKSMDRVHNSVKGWGSYAGNAGNAAHSYTCAKCHTPHDNNLPRLLVTDCLDFKHRGQVASGGTALNTNAGSGDEGSGSGYGPGGGGGRGSEAIAPGPWAFGSTSNGSRSCHDVSGAGGTTGYPANQLWNNVTPW